MDAPLRIERSGPVLTVTLDDPATRNAQTPALWRALARAAEQVPDDVAVVVLRGAGDTFSAGLHRGMLAPGGLPGAADIVGMAVREPDAVDAEIADYQKGFTAWSEVPAIVVAAVQGYAIGAGFQLALAADLRVCADDVKFAMRETSLGLVPDLAGTTPLVRLVGYPRALEICATGRFVAADEAARLGLANVVVPRADLDATVDDLVAAVAAAPAHAVRELKPLLAGAAVLPRDDQLARERAAQVRCLTTLARAAGARHTDPPGPAS